MLQRPPEGGSSYGSYADYGDPPPPESTVAMSTMVSPSSESAPFRHPEPVGPLLDTRAVIGLTAVALLVGFMLAAILFGVVLRPDVEESVAGLGADGAALVDEPAAPQTIDGGEADPLDPLSSDGESDLVIPPAGDDAAMTDSATESTVADTVPPSSSTTAAASTTSSSLPATTASTVAPTTAAPTTAAPATTAPTTAPPTTAAPAPAPAGNDAAAQQQILDLTNARRAEAGCPALSLNSNLNAAADGHSEDMSANNYFDHTGRDGSQPWDRARAAGYPSGNIGENIAQGYRSAESVIEGWMNSPGHRRNMLTCSWTELGVGFAEGNYWTQVFGRR